MAYNTSEGVDFSGKRVFIRVDYNVPTNQEGVVVDDRRIRRTVPLLKKLIDQGAKLVIACHKGRPKGKVVETERMGGVAKHVSELLGRPVLKLDECVGEKVKEKISQKINESCI